MKVICQRSLSSEPICAILKSNKVIKTKGNTKNDSYLSIPNIQQIAWGWCVVIYLFEIKKANK